MAKTAIERLAVAIGYPDAMPEGDESVTLRVDDAEIKASVSRGRLVLSQRLTDDAALFPELAAFAAGRMLREDAVLSFGDGAAFLWQDAPADAGEHELSRLFETFANSCDWWRERIEAGEDEPRAELTESMIRP